MRKDNRIARYIYGPSQIIARARDVLASGIKVVSLQGGELPRTTPTVGAVIPAIREMFGDDVDVLLVLGDKSDEEYAYLRAQGATSYILKHETSDAHLHLEHRYYPLEARIGRIESLLALGFRVGIGTIVGLPGQTIDTLANDILLGATLGAHMWSASPFVPVQGTPLEDCASGDVDLTLNAIAAARLVLPDALIPSVSALETLFPGAQAGGFQAGANVMTVNFTRIKDRSNYPIYGSNRFVVELDYAADLLRRAGLQSPLRPCCS
jgi:biotin synthase